MIDLKDYDTRYGDVKKILAIRVIIFLFDYIVV